MAVAFTTVTYEPKAVTAVTWAARTCAAVTVGVALTCAREAVTCAALTCSAVTYECVILIVRFLP
jgi:hypothetical protein